MSPCICPLLTCLAGSRPGGSDGFAVKEDGSVVAWGAGASCWVDVGLGGYVRLDGCSQCLEDGSVATWGRHSWNFCFGLL